MLEDLTELSGHPGALDELSQLLDALEVRQAAVLITSRSPLADIKGLPAGLRSRLAGGLIITPRDARTTGHAPRLLRRLAARRKTAIEPDAMELLAERLNATAVELRPLR